MRGGGFASIPAGGVIEKNYLSVLDVGGVEEGSWCTYVALAADGLLAVVLGGEGLQGGLDDTTTQAQDEVKGGLLQVESHVSCAVPDV